MALAVVHVGGQPNEGNPNTSDTWAATAGSLIVVILQANPGVTAWVDGSVTDGGNTYTRVVNNLPGGGACGTGIWYNNAGAVRSGSHQISVSVTGGSVAISVIEITGQDAVAPFDTTTDAIANDGVSAYNVTAAAAIVGNQIAIYSVTVDGFANNAFTQPGGYSVIQTQPDGVTHLIFDTAYKINETGTPTVGATRAEVTSSAAEVFATFKEAGGAGTPALSDNPPMGISGRGAGW